MMISGKKLNQTIKQHLLEAKNVDSYVVRPNPIGGGNTAYSIDNASDLSRFLHDPHSKIDNGEFVYIQYVEEEELNKTFRNVGYTDETGNFTSADDIESQGRALNKPFLTAFYDSDEYKTKRPKKRGANRPFAVFTLKHQQLNWNAMNYGKSKAAIDKIFDDASDADLEDFVMNDPDFAKRLNKYREKNPGESDELDVFANTRSFPRDVINKIRDTKLNDEAGKGWVPKDDYVSVHNTTNNEALRLTKSSKLLSNARYYVVLASGEIKEISEDVYNHLKLAFGGDAKKTKPNTVMTSVRQAIDAVKDRYQFRNYKLPHIATISFEANGKSVHYVNHNLEICGITIDADNIPKIELAENKMGMRRNKIRLSESQLRNIIKHSIKNILRENY